MNMINKVADQSESTNAIERLQSENVRDNKLNDKKKRILDDLGQIWTVLNAQLPPETIELVQQFAFLSAQKNSADDLAAAQSATQSNVAVLNLRQDVPVAAAPGSDTATAAKVSAMVSQAGEKAAAIATQPSTAGKQRDELDDMMLAALSSALTPQPPLPATVVRAKDEGESKPVSGKRLKETDKDDTNQADQVSQPEPVRQVADNQNTVPVASDRNAAFANSQPGFVPQVFVPTQSGQQSSGQQTSGQQSSIHLDATNATAMPRNLLDDVERAESKSEKLSLSTNAINENEATRNQVRRKNHDENPDDLNPAQQATVTSPNFQNAMNVPMQAPTPTPTQSQQAMEQQRTALFAQDKIAATDGIRYNLSSWGQDQSVQIVGSSKTGYTLRPSDGQVQSILEQHKTDALNISIEHAEEKSGGADDIKAVRIKAISDKESAL